MDINFDDIETEIAFAKIRNDLDTEHAMLVIKLLQSDKLTEINTLPRQTGKTSVLIKTQRFLDHLGVKNIIISPHGISKYVRQQYSYARICEITETRGNVYDILLIDDYSELSLPELSLINKYHPSTKRYGLCTPRKQEWGPFGTNP